MVTSRSLVAVVTAGLSGIVSCAADDADVPTGSLGPVYLAQATADGMVRVVGNFTLDDGFYQLTDGEMLVAKVGDQTTEMVLSPTSDDPRYIAALPIEPVADTRFAIELYRSGTLITSTMGFPAPFEVSAVASTIPRDQVISLSWAPADSGDDLTNVLIDARPCTPRFQNSDRDPSTVMFTMMGPDDQDCAVTVGLFRDRDAEANPAFDKGGVLYAEQARFVSFTSTAL